MLISDKYCTCPDKEYNLEDGELCKHERRVRFATGQWAVPAWANPDAIDPQLGYHLDESPRIAATDGGIIEASDDGEVLNDRESADKGQKRPEDCDCGDWNQGQGFACWPCYREGLEIPSPDTTESE